MRETADPRVHDSELLAEIELYADVMIAASQSPGPMAAGPLDRVLGVAPATAALLHR